MPENAYPPQRIDSRGSCDEGAAKIEVAVARLGFGQGLVLLSFARSEEVHDVVPAGVEEFGDQASVAAPPEGLRAQEAGGWFRDRCGERRLPSLGAHAGGVAPERGDTDAAEGVLARFADETTSEFNCMSVGDAALLERSSESGLVELRVVTRTREAPHIDERDDAGLANDGREFVDGPSPVADRPDDHHIRMPRFPIFRMSVSHLTFSPFPDQGGHAWRPARVLPAAGDDRRARARGGSVADDDVGGGPEPIEVHRLREGVARMYLDVRCPGWGRVYPAGL